MPLGQHFVVLLGITEVQWNQVLPGWADVQVRHLSRECELRRAEIAKIAGIAGIAEIERQKGLPRMNTDSADQAKYARVNI